MALNSLFFCLCLQVLGLHKCTTVCVYHRLCVPPFGFLPGLFTENKETGWAKRSETSPHVSATLREADPIDSLGPALPSLFDHPKEGMSSEDSLTCEGRGSERSQAGQQIKDCHLDQ